MRLQRKYLRIMSALVPMGTVGASLLLGSVLPSAAAERPTQDMMTVSERLSAIRDAVFVVIDPAETSIDKNIQQVWGNWGWRGRRRWPSRWNNWRNGWPNWSNFWRNW